jgi:predicted permease
MSLLRSIAGGLRSLFRKERVSQELDEELNGFLEMAADEKIRLGMSRKDALRAVRLERGSLEVAKEVVRSAGWESFVETFWQDLCFAARMLRKSPVFTTVAVLTLALGIGANTAIFTVINSVLLNTLPVNHPEQLVLLSNPDEQGRAIGFDDGVRSLLTYPEFQDIAQHNAVFSGVLAASSYTSSIPTAVEGSGGSVDAAPAEVKLVSGSYFSVLDVNPILGRAFTTEVDNLRDANPVAAISYGFWQERFAGARDVIGRKLRVLKTTYTIIGVTPAGFHGETVGANPEIFVPLSMQSEISPGRDYLSRETNPFVKTEWLQVIGRLTPGVSLAQAKAAIDVEFRQMMQAQAAGMSAHDKQQFMTQTLSVTGGSRGASTLRGDFGKPLEILMAVVGLILLIACTNIANILLARTAARQKEVAARVALGASGARLVRQMLTESVLLATIGAWSVFCSRNGLRFPCSAWFPPEAARFLLI